MMEEEFNSYLEETSGLELDLPQHIFNANLIKGFPPWY